MGSIQIWAKLKSFAELSRAEIGLCAGTSALSNARTSVFLDAVKLKYGPNTNSLVKGSYLKISAVGHICRKIDSD